MTVKRPVRLAGVALQPVLKPQEGADFFMLCLGLNKSCQCKTPHRVRCVAGWINYLLLPEVINREWNGQGLISWARSHVYAPLKRRCNGVRNTRVAVNIVPLQV
jgi:hypothetical protein